MTDRSTSKPSDVASRRAAWEAERLDPALRRAPERKSRFSTLSDMPIEGLYGPWSLAEDADARIALVGDWNIAPQDDDVWDMSVFSHSTHVSEPERAAFRAIVDAGYADVVRPYAPGPGVYTYWDYVRLRFPRREGMRIDFVLGSPALTARVTGAVIDREERKGKGASDHAPVVVDLAD